MGTEVYYKKDQVSKWVCYTKVESWQRESTGNPPIEERTALYRRSFGQVSKLQNMRKEDSYYKHSSI